MRFRYKQGQSMTTGWSELKRLCQHLKHVMEGMKNVKIAKLLINNAKEPPDPYKIILIARFQNSWQLFLAKKPKTT